jgi:hypothetical protein
VKRGFGTGAASEQFCGALEEVKQRIYEKYRARIARADFLEAIRLTCEMHEKIDEEIDRLLAAGELG